MDIKTEVINGKKWVHSVDFYQHSGLHPAHYMRWVGSRITRNPLAFQTVDYFETNDDRKVTNGYYKKYYLSLSFAKQLCVVVGTCETKELKEWILKEEKK